MTPAVLEKTIFLRASPETVWTWLTDPDCLAQWFHRPKAPLREGGRLEMPGPDGAPLIWGEIRAARPPRYLEYSFTVRPMGEAESLVIWRLDPVAGGTRLALRHEGLPQTAEGFGLVLALDAGWEEHFARLRPAIIAPAPV